MNKTGQGLSTDHGRCAPDPAVLIAGNAATGVATDLQQTVRKVNAPDGPLQIAEGTQALSQAAESLGRSTLPRMNGAADDVSRAARSMARPRGLLQ
jgi:phospholipid/cholesterol/gamma-HCH transport system substrate-binding protein